MPTGLPDRVGPLHVLGVGAVGGALSWVFAITIGVRPVLNQVWLAVPATMLLGAGAAYIGVYLLASSDTAQVHRCLAFALVCGVAWKPVWDAGTALVDQTTRQHRLYAEATRLEVRSREVTRALAETSAAATPQIVAEAGKVSLQLTEVASATETSNPELAARLRLQAAATVTAAAEAEAKTRDSTDGAPEAGGTTPAVSTLPIDDTRFVLIDAQRRWSERDPERAQQFERAIGALDRAVALKADPR